MKGALFRSKGDILVELREARERIAALEAERDLAQANERLTAGILEALRSDYKELEAERGRWPSPELTALEATRVDLAAARERITELDKQLTLGVEVIKVHAERITELEAERVKFFDLLKEPMNQLSEAKARVAELEASLDRLRGVLEHARGAGCWATMQEIVREVTDKAWSWEEDAKP